MDNKIVFDFQSDTEWVTLSTEDGDEFDCEIIRRFDMNDVTYVLIRPAEESDIVEAGEFLCRYVEDEDGSFMLEDIEDDTELNEAYAYLKQLNRIEEI